MKKLRSALTIVSLVFAVFLLSSFTPTPTPDSDSDNGVEVVVIHGTWYLGACGSWFATESSTEVYLDATRVLIINKWKLPEGNCLIPTDGKAAIYPNLIVTPNGTAIGKAIVHPERGSKNK